MYNSSFEAEEMIKKLAKTPAEEAQMRRFLKGSARQPLSFWQNLAAIAQHIVDTEATGPAGADSVEIVSADGANVVSVSRSLALQRCADGGGFRLATKDDIRKAKVEALTKKLKAEGVTVEVRRNDSTGEVAR